MKAGTKGDVLATRSQIITWINEESRKEHIGPSALKKASTSTIRRILVERAAQWAQTKTVTATPLYRAVAHVSLRNFLCNAACLHCVQWRFDCITVQFLIVVIIDAEFQVLFFDRSEAAVFAKLCCSDGDADQLCLLSLACLAVACRSRQLTHCSAKLATR